MGPQRPGTNGPLGPHGFACPSGGGPRWPRQWYIKLPWGVTSPGELNRHRQVVLEYRPYRNAEANRFGGGGTETDLNYAGCRVRFLGIDNIHVMRESLSVLRAALCQVTLFTANANVPILSIFG